MNYFETELIFTCKNDSSESLSRGVPRASGSVAPEMSSDNILGIMLRLGNSPLVFDIQALAKRKNISDEEIASCFDNDTDSYLIVHAINALRVNGRAKVDELQYYAEAHDPCELQTIDLIPSTRFNEVLSAGAIFSGLLEFSGKADYEIPSGLDSLIIQDVVEIGAGIKLEVISKAGFVAKFTFNFQPPIIQSGGVASNRCYWVINPDENKTPLLGDHLLIQSVKVPKGCPSIKYTIRGGVKADRGLLWKQQELRTDDFLIEVKLK